MKGHFGRRVKLPPVRLPATHGRGFILPLVLLNVKQETVYTNDFIVFGLTQSGMELESTISVTDAPSIRPLVGFD